jgi:hypothetical protein
VTSWHLTGAEVGLESGFGLHAHPAHSALPLTPQQFRTWM